MEQKTLSPKEVQKRKMLLVLPVITLPFITMLFYVLGGGKMNGLEAEHHSGGGFNFKLPVPAFKQDSALDKMSYYTQAAADSLRIEEQIKKDPNYAFPSAASRPLPGMEETDFEMQRFYKKGQGLNMVSLQDQKQQQVYQKLRALQKAVSRPSEPDKYGQEMREFENYGSSKELSGQIQNLEQLISGAGEPQQPDPELLQLGGMLENILDIQHPSRVEERLKKSSESRKGKSFTVSPKKEDDNITSLQRGIQPADDSAVNSFYPAQEPLAGGHSVNAFEAVMHETQTIAGGSVVKLRLIVDIMLQGVLIPKNTFIYGTAALKGERLQIKIENIHYRGSIFPVDLSVYDIDGIQGIYIPGALGRDSAKASADRSIQALAPAGLSDSWTAQAAGMGIEAAKGLMSRKVKLIKAVVKAGYRVLLYDEKQNNFTN